MSSEPGGNTCALDDNVYNKMPEDSRSSLDKLDRVGPNPTRMYVDSCSSIHCVGTTHNLQNQCSCSMSARHFKGGLEISRVMGDLYVVIVSVENEPRVVIVKDVYVFEGAPRLLLSYPRLMSKGCELFLSKSKSHMKIPAKEGEGFLVPVRVDTQSGMPYLQSAFMGDKNDVANFHKREMAKSHWHLNAVTTIVPHTSDEIAEPNETHTPDIGRVEGRSPTVPSASHTPDRTYEVGDDTTMRVLKAAKAMVSPSLLQTILSAPNGAASLKVGLISVGSGSLDGFGTAAQVLGVPVLGGFEKDLQRKNLHEKIHGIKLGFDAKSPTRDYLHTLDTRAQDLGVTQRIACLTCPCQPWFQSTAGRQKGGADLRVFTVDDIMKILSRLDASTMIWENVPSVPEAYVSSLTKALERAGYHVSSQRIDASTLGNAQVRTRLFICAMQKGPCPLRKYPIRTVESKTIGDYLEDSPTDGVFSTHEFDLVDSDELILADKPTLIARFRGWEDVKSHWPGLGFSIYSSQGFAPTIRAWTSRRREQQPAGPRGTVLHDGKPRMISVDEAIRIQGFNPRWVRGLDDDFATQIIGESVSVEQSAAVLASVLVALKRAIDRQGNDPSVSDNLIDDFDVSPSLDMKDHAARGSHKIKTSPRGVSRAQAHEAWNHCGRDVTDMLPLLQQFVPHTHYYRDKDGFRCEACELAKNVHVRDTVKPVIRRTGSAGRSTSKPGELIHIDPMAKQRAFSLGGHTTAMVLVDDYSGFPYVKLLDKTSSLPSAFATFCREFIHPKRVRCDNACGRMLKNTCKTLDITIELIVPYVPHQNGRSE